MRRDYFDFRPVRPAAAGALVAVALFTAGCSTSDVIGTKDVFYQGYVVDEERLQLVKEGSSREQVVLTLGQPSTTATFDNEVLFYISQRKERRFEFQKPRLVNQEILAVYFNSNGRVDKIARYTLEDGKVVDMVSDTTPTGGKDITFIQQILQGTGASAARDFFATNGGAIQ
ncbi:outer membrane protein assembly factor BamE [Martelella sp. AD-3]|uniref:outer membrane protein assembly factor BamE n=1 Tax=Martelella sp. AD-3 TaxID=686597 RepID=UPI000467AB9F|nr:outer membrane protein assembly factor BamE [Martelella sp. AD-3]AMM83764.1 small protein A [Martelella sp. AD-3]